MKQRFYVAMKTRVMVIGTAAVALIMLTASCKGKQAEQPVDDFPKVEIEMPEKEARQIDESMERIRLLRQSATRPTQEEINRGTDLTGLPITNPKEMDALYSTADSIWGVFCSLCEKGEYEKAWEYYYTDENNCSNFVIALRLTLCQYEFFKNVLGTLDNVYDPYNSMRKISENMELCLATATLTYTINYKEDHYIPPHYSDLFYLTIGLYKQRGMDEKVEEIINKYGDVICFIEKVSEEELKQSLNDYFKELE